MPALIDLTGMKFGEWTILGRSSNKSGGKRLWDALCSCGTRRSLQSMPLRNGKTLSCGCQRSENLKTHGMKGTTEYTIWKGMKGRCYYKKHVGYKRYGGRGIKMSDDWKNSFECFYRDMGPRPSLAHSIDRINGNGHYEKSNCRWATSLEQAHNKTLYASP